MSVCMCVGMYVSTLAICIRIGVDYAKKRIVKRAKADVGFNY